MDPPELRTHLGLTVFDNAPCLVAVVDSDYRIVLANETFRHAFGDRAGEPCYAVYKGRDQICDDCSVSRTFADGRQRLSEEEGVDQEGELLRYQVSIYPIFEARSEDVAYALQMSLDTTRTMELERGLEQAERLANVGLTVGGLAHTVKNILAGLDGGMYMVDSGLEKEDLDRIKGGWGMVQKYVDQVSSLVHNLLRYARAERPAPKETAPRRLVEEVIELYASKAGLAGIELTGQVEESLPSLLVDPDAMSASLANLVANALDACMWDPDTEREHRISVSARRGDTGNVHFEVRDNGMGIEEENQRKVLSALFTTKGMSGTGLGLLLTKKAVEQHGGAVGFTSTPGQGTTFWIEIPPCSMRRQAETRRESQVASD